VISKTFCEMMGGQLTVASELGKGSTFTVTLPVEVAESTRSGQPVLAPAAGAPTGLAGRASSTILVIDDEASARDLMQRDLTKEGYCVETAASGPEGISRARRLKPAAITLDVMMPGMDGWAVLTLLKADPATVDIPVVMLTVVDDKNLGFALGATDYLLKPIEWERLIAVLQKLQGRAVGSQVPYHRGRSRDARPAAPGRRESRVGKSLKLKMPCRPSSALPTRLPASSCSIS